MATDVATVKARLQDERAAVVAELAAIDAEWRQAATQNVTQKYGSDFAVPVKTADNRSVVAFASVRASGVQVASDTYELNFSAAQFAMARRAGVRVPHEGSQFAVLDTEASFE